METEIFKAENLLEGLKEDKTALGNYAKLKELYEERIMHAAVQLTGNETAAETITRCFFELIWKRRRENNALQGAAYLICVFLQAAIPYMEMHMKPNVNRVFYRFKFGENELMSIIEGIING